MKAYFSTICIVAFLSCSTTFGQVGIGTTQPDKDAVLELFSSNGGLLLPRISLVDPLQPLPLIDHVAGMIVYNTTMDASVALQPGLYYNNGNKWLPFTSSGAQTSDFANVVYVNAANPTSATIFDLVSPPMTHNQSLEEDNQNLYVGNDASAYVWDGTSYIPFSTPAATPWNLRSSNIDAGDNKSSHIERYSDIYVQDVRLGIGGGNVSTNTVVGGGGALGVNTSGDNNVAIGFFALGSNLSGSSNFGMGFSSLGANTSGSFNVGLGRATLRWSTGSYNQAIGMQSFSRAGLSGSENVGIGWLTGLNTTGSASSNTFLGSRAGRFHVAGSRNTAVGATAELPDNSASNQVSIQNSLFAINATATDPTQAAGSWGVNAPSPNSTLEIAGSLGANIRVMTNTFLMQPEDHTIIMTGAGTAVALPDPTTASRRMIYIRNASAGNVSINGHIDNSSVSSVTIVSGQTRTLQSDGTTWYIIGGLN